MGRASFRSEYRAWFVAYNNTPGNYYDMPAKELALFNIKHPSK